jgi:plastocyanin
MRARTLMIAGLIVVTTGLGLAACGGGGSKTTSSATTASSAPSNAGGAVTLSLATKDFMFVPTTLSAPAGKPVTVNIKNEGTAEHNFSITSLKVNKDLKPGESAVVTFTPPQPGTLQFFCEYHKTSNNMVGSLNVT